MKSSREKTVQSGIITAGRELAALGLVCCRSGNLSARLDGASILITATGSQLGELKSSDIVKTDILSGRSSGAGKRPSSESPMHRLIYANFPCQAVIHCHPPLINAYFAVLPELKAVTFETLFYLKEVPVISQRGINVTDPPAVIRALKKSGIVVLKNHGVFSIAADFKQALDLVLVLEEAAKAAALTRIFNKSALDKLDREIKRWLLKRK